MKGRVIQPITKEHFKSLFSILRYPIEGFEEMRYRALGSRELAAVLYALFFALIVTERQWTGYLFNYAQVEKLNILIMAALSLGLPLLWIVSNTAVCTLTDGEGSFTDIFIVTAYALLPYMLFSPALTIVSNILVRDEGLYFTIFRFVQTAWTGVLLFCGVMTAHQYTVKKTIFTIFLTVVGMFIILFLMFLAFVLVQQLAEFARTVVYEIIYMQ